MKLAKFHASLDQMLGGRLTADSSRTRLGLLKTPLMRARYVCMRAVSPAGTNLNRHAADMVIGSASIRDVQVVLRPRRVHVENHSSTCGL